MTQIDREKLIGIRNDKYDFDILSLKERVEKGDRLLELSGDYEIVESQEDQYHNAIILKPFYQRDYRFSIQDESSLIESILLAIPIPPIFLAVSNVRSLDVFNVVDGQHRLRAIYRFMSNQFKLKDLPILNQLNGKKYDNLSREEKKTIKDFTITTYVFNKTPGFEFELELFNRYNKGTKPLTQQEIRNAVFSSPFSDYVNGFVAQLNQDENSFFFKAYYLTKDRKLKKKVHENIMTILYILEHGIERNFKDSTVYANKYMEDMALLYNNSEINTSIKLAETKDRFLKFNNWIKCLTSLIPGNCVHPFSKEIYNISVNQKFQTSIDMILAGIYHKIISTNCEMNALDTLTKIQSLLSNSFLENPNYRASTTSSREIYNLIECFDVN